VITRSAEKRALHLYELAWALVKAEGAAVTLGVVTFREYRSGGLTIHYLPKSGHLDIWYRRKVLTIDRWDGPPKVTHYVPGNDWEDGLEAAATKSSPKR
jgi:hypothetical protein